MNIDKKVIVAGVVILISIFAVFIVKKRKEASDQSASYPQIELKAESPRVIEPSSITKAPINVGASQVIFKRDKTEKSIGLKRMSLPREGSNAILNVLLRVKQNCDPGDMDAIIKELSLSPSHKLLATMEDLSKKEKALSWDVPKSFFQSGAVQYTFRVPIKADPTQYGFFLCTADGTDNTCSDKEVSDINDIFVTHLNQTATGESLKTIFFQYFLVDDRGIAAFSQVSKGKTPYNNLKRYLAEIKASGKEDHSEVDAMKNTLQTINSLPAVFSNGQLVLDLPKFSEKACRIKR